MTLTIVSLVSTGADGATVSTVMLTAGDAVLVCPELLGAVRTCVTLVSGGGVRLPAAGSALALSNKAEKTAAPAWGKPPVAVAGRTCAVSANTGAMTLQAAIESAFTVPIWVEPPNKSVLMLAPGAPGGVRRRPLATPSARKTLRS